MTELGQPVYRITLNQALAMRLTGCALALLYVGLAIVFAVAPAGGYRIENIRALLWGVVGMAAVFVGTLVVHELVHGFFMRLFGARPKYGIGRIGWFGFYAYATAPGVPFTLMQMTVICLAPFVLITAGALTAGLLTPAVAGLTAVAFVTNFSGAAGDLWMVVQMWRFRRCRELRFVDTATGLDIHTPDSSASIAVTTMRANENGRIVQRLLIRWLVAATLIATGTVVLSVPLSLLSAGDVAIGPKQFQIAAYKMIPGGGIGVSIDIGAICVVALAGAGLSLLLAAPSNKRRDDPASGSPPHPAFL